MALISIKAHIDSQTEDCIRGFFNPRPGTSLLNNAPDCDHTRLLMQPMGRPLALQTQRFYGCQPGIFFRTHLSNVWWLCIWSRNLARNSHVDFPSGAGDQHALWDLLSLLAVGLLYPFFCTMICLYRFHITYFWSIMFPLGLKSIDNLQIASRLYTCLLAVRNNHTYSQGAHRRF